MVRGSVGVLVLVAWLGTAGADTTTNEDVLTRSRSIQSMEVERAEAGRVTGRFQKPWGGLFAPEPVLFDSSLVIGEGTKLWQICDFAACPQWLGIERDGFVVFRFAQTPTDNIAPGIAVKDFMSDRLESELCFRARVVFIDRPYKWSRLEGSVDAKTGQGMVWGKAVGKPRKVLMRAGGGAGGWPAEALMLTIDGPKGEVTLAGGPITRAEDRCFEVDLAPAFPVVRTPDALIKALGGVGPGPVAHGSIKRGPRSFPLTITADDDGNLRLLAVIFADKAASAKVNPTTGNLLIAIDSPDGKDTYLLDAGADLMPPLPGAGPLAAIAEALKRDPELTWKVFVNGTEVGTVVVRR